jgi:hypothetical protein
MIIDKNGKIFSKVSIVDVLVIGLILVIGLTLGIKLTGSASKLGLVEEHKSKITVLATVPGYYANDLNVGDLITQDKKEYGTKVTNITIIDKKVSGFDISGNKVISTDPVLKEILIEFEAPLTKKGEMYKLGKYEYRVGTPVFFETQKYYMSSIVKSIEILE